MARALLALLLGCSADAAPHPDATTIHILGNDTPDACVVAETTGCCAQLPDLAAARACFAAELSPGRCAELVCSCGVLAVCHR